MHETTTTTKTYCLLLGMKPDIKHHNDGQLLDYLLMGGSLTLVLGTIITVITSYYFCYYREKKRGKMQADMKVYSGQCALIECRLEELRARIHDSLMSNPIYNSMPVYMSKFYHETYHKPQPQYIIINETKRNTLGCKYIYMCQSSCELPISRSENRYIDQPMDVQNDLQLIASNETFEKS